MRKQNPATALTSHIPESTTLSRPALRPLDAAASASRKVSQNQIIRPDCATYRDKIIRPDCATYRDS